MMRKTRERTTVNILDDVYIHTSKTPDPTTIESEELKKQQLILYGLLKKH